MFRFHGVLRAYTHTHIRTRLLIYTHTHAYHVRLYVHTQKIWLYSSSSSTSKRRRISWARDVSLSWSITSLQSLTRSLYAWSCTKNPRTSRGKGWICLLWKICTCMFKRNCIRRKNWGNTCTWLGCMFIPVVKTSGRWRWRWLMTDDWWWLMMTDELMTWWKRWIHFT